jgi:hypothetical protein
LALDLIFSQQLKTGLLPIGHIVSNNFTLNTNKDGDITVKETLLTAKPILSSVECFNDILCQEEFKLQLGEKYEKNFKILFNWLIKNLRKINKNNPVNKTDMECPIGWTSEYEGIYEPVSWVSAHAIIFIDQYNNILSNEIERIINKELHTIMKVDSRKEFEDLGDSYGALKFLDKMCLKKGEKWIENDEFRSALLFGPPGSGKSTVAKALAKRLKWKYVEITPGQFLDQGDQNIIKNAYNIFKKLVLMKESVIFFDEVDQLIKARKDNTESSNWIVTALLPKFQQLRECKKIIFILAMNNVRGADPAALRRGRIDFVLPLGGMFWKDRLKLLKKMLEKECVNPDKLPEELRNLMDAKLEDFTRNSAVDELSKFLKRTDHIPVYEVSDIIEIFNSEDWDINPLYEIIFKARDDHPDLNMYIDKDFLEFHLNLMGHNKDGVDLKSAFKIPSSLKQEYKINDIIKENTFQKFNNPSFSRGFSHFVKGDYINALEAFEMATNEDASDSDAWHYKALTLYALEKFEAANIASDTAERLRENIQ